MLLIYYCNEPECRRAYIRSDERPAIENQICPNCNMPMYFVSDYRYWSSITEERRKMLVKRRLKNPPFTAVQGGTGKGPSRPRTREELVAENQMLQEEHERLKRSLLYYTRLRQYWEKVARRLHDAIWTVLVRAEPDRYGVLYPEKKFDENIQEVLDSMPQLKA